MSSLLRDALIKEFRAGEDAVDLVALGALDACVEMCETFGIAAEDLELKFSAYNFKQTSPVSLSTFNDFRLRELSKRPRGGSAAQFIVKRDRASVVTTTKDDMLRKRPRDSSEGAHPIGVADSGFGTPAGAGGVHAGGYSGSPLTTGPSSQYVERKDSGAIKVALNPELGALRSDAAGARDVGVDVSTWHAASSIGRHMWERLEDKADALDKHTHELGELICASEGLAEPTSVLRATIDEVTAVGRVVCDVEGKLNPQSVFLETTRHSSAGVRVKLDLKDVPDFAIFRGQVIAVRGSNARGSLISATALHPPRPCPPPPPPRDEAEGVRVLVAVGPYTTDDSLSYRPLLDLLEAAEKHAVHALILLGPFVDEAHPALREGRLEGLTFDALYRKMVVNVLRAWLAAQRKRGPAPTVVLCPSPADLHAHPSFPQGPLGTQGSEGAESEPALLSVRNPSTLAVGGFVFGLTAIDSLKALSAELCSRDSLPPSQRVDRLSVLCRQVVEQRLFLPVYPPPKELAVNCVLSLDVGALPVTPHVLILPSDLNALVKIAAGVVCINPGRLVHCRMHGGTYALVHIHPAKEAASETAAAGDAESTTSIAQRTCVQIVRI